MDRLTDQLTEWQNIYIDRQVKQLSNKSLHNYISIYIGS